MPAFSLNSVMTKAESIALGLIKNDLKPTDPKHATLCKKLERFRPLLAKHKTSSDDSQVRSLLQNGFRAVKFKVDPTATEEAEVLRLLNGLADKLGGMLGMLGGLL